jgi:hypothetical protein
MANHGESKFLTKKRSFQNYFQKDPEKWKALLIQRAHNGIHPDYQAKFDVLFQKDRSALEMDECILLRDPKFNHGFILNRNLTNRARREAIISLIFVGCFGGGFGWSDCFGSSVMVWKVF